MRRVGKRNFNVPDVLVASARITTPAQFLRNRRIDPFSDAEAWRWYDAIGEVHFGISAGAREASRATLKVVRWQDPDTPVDFDDETGGVPIQAFLDAVQSPNGGQCQIINAYYANRKVAGDGYLFGYPDPDDPEYLWFDFLSPDELDVDQPNAKIRRKRAPVMNNQQIEEDTYSFPDVILSRIWTPHPRFTAVADSGLKALHTVCEELDILTRSLKAKITSRLATAGFLLIPSSIANSQPIPPPSAEQAKFSENPFINWVVNQMTQAILDPSSAAAAVPFVLTVPDNAVDLVKWVREEAQTFETDIKQRAELISRILHGLDLRPEQIKGFGESNHWSAWSSQDVHVKVDVAPDIEALCWALTKDYLWHQIRAAVNAKELDSRINWTEEEIRRWTVWYDLDNLTVRPNKADSYLNLADRAVISRSALREATGATDKDEPDEEEYVRMLGVKGLSPADIYAATQGMNIQEKIDWDKLMELNQKAAAAPPGPTPDGSKPNEAPSGPGKSAPGPKPSDSSKPKTQQPQ